MESQKDATKWENFNKESIYDNTDIHAPTCFRTQNVNLSLGNGQLLYILHCSPELYMHSCSNSKKWKRNEKKKMENLFQNRLPHTKKRIKWQMDFAIINIFYVRYL